MVLTGNTEIIAIFLIYIFEIPLYHFILRKGPGVPVKVQVHFYLMVLLVEALNYVTHDVQNMVDFPL